MATQKIAKIEIKKFKMGGGFFQGNLVIVGKFAGIVFLGEVFPRTVINNPLLRKSYKLWQSFTN